MPVTSSVSPPVHSGIRLRPAASRTRTARSDLGGDGDGGQAYRRPAATTQRPGSRAAAVTGNTAGRDGGRRGGLRHPAQPRWLSGVAGGAGPGDAHGDRAGGLVHPPGRARRPGGNSAGARDRGHSGGRRGGRRAPGEGRPGPGRSAGRRGAGGRPVPADLGGRRVGPGDTGLVAAAGHPGGLVALRVRAVLTYRGGDGDQRATGAAGISHARQVRAGLPRCGLPHR